MKKIILIVMICFISTNLFSQKNEKIKASKIVTTTQKELISFKELEIWNNLDVLLIKGNTCNLEIEADDNLHETFIIKNVGKKTIISNNSKISGAKKMLLKLTYNDSLQTIILKDDVKVSANDDFTNNTINITTYNDSKIKIGIRNINTTLKCNDDSEIDVVVQTENFGINAGNSSEITGMVNSKKAIINLFEKSKIKIEGTTEDLKISIKDNSNFLGKNFTSSICLISSKNKSESEINCKNNLTINAINNSKIEIYGAPKFEIEAFDGEANLQKKGFKN